MQDQARQLAILHAVTQSLAGTPKGEDLLRHVAWNTLNMLAADVVTIYEYLEAEERFFTPPDIAGLLRAEGAMTTAVGEHDAPVLLVANRKNVYAERSAESSILNHPARQPATGKAPL
jgi:hypothetical protein